VLLINRASGDAAIAKGDSAPVSKMKAIHIYCLLFTDCGLWPILLLRFTTSRRAVWCAVWEGIIVGSSC
jgi:hypothetical protein